MYQEIYRYLSPTFNQLLTGKTETSKRLVSMLLYEVTNNDLQCTLLSTFFINKRCWKKYALNIYKQHVSIWKWTYAINVYNTYATDLIKQGYYYFFIILFIHLTQGISPGISKIIKTASSVETTNPGDQQPRNCRVCNKIYHYY